jgi:aminoglycoside 6'-N-acetyltransferase I
VTNAECVRLERASGASDPRWLALRCALWLDADADEHARDMKTIAARGDLVVLAIADDGSAIGFAEAAKRTDWVDGTSGSPVGFLEGLYVASAFRRRGVARALVAAVERWTIEQGLAELASNARLDNAEAHAVHRALGFAETERVVFFCKRATR